MKNYFKALIIFIAVPVVFASCSMVQNLKSAIAMKDCNYSYNSISNVHVGEISASDGLSFMTLAKVANLLGNASTTLPVSMNINVNVENPNAVSAGFEKVSYKVDLDTIHITSGVLTEAFSVDAGSTTILPVNLQVDLRQLITKQNGNSITNLAKNLLGMTTSEPSKLKLSIKPTILLGGKTTFTAPNYIPIEFYIGEKEK